MFFLFVLMQTKVFQYCTGYRATCSNVILSESKLSAKCALHNYTNVLDGCTTGIAAITGEMRLYIYIYIYIY